MTERGQNMELAEGDDKTIVVTVSEEDGTSKDLTDASVEYELSRYRGGSATISEDTSTGVSITNATGGEVEVSLDSSDTSSLNDDRVYYHKLVVTDSNGVISTVLTGEVYILS